MKLTLNNAIVDYIKELVADPEKLRDLFLGINPSLKQKLDVITDQADEAADSSPIFARIKHYQHLLLQQGEAFYEREWNQEDAVLSDDDKQAWTLLVFGDLLFCLSNEDLEGPSPMSVIERAVYQLSMLRNVILEEQVNKLDQVLIKHCRKHQYSAPVENCLPWLLNQDNAMIRPDDQARIVVTPLIVVVPQDGGFSKAKVLAASGFDRQSNEETLFAPSSRLEQKPFYEALLKEPKNKALTEAFNRLFTQLCLADNDAYGAMRVAIYHLFLVTAPSLQGILVNSPDAIHITFNGNDAVDPYALSLKQGDISAQIPMMVFVSSRNNPNIQQQLVAQSPGRTRFIDVSEVTDNALQPIDTRFKRLVHYLTAIFSGCTSWQGIERQCLEFTHKIYDWSVLSDLTIPFSDIQAMLACFPLISSGDVLFLCLSVKGVSLLAAFLQAVQQGDVSSQNVGRIYDDVLQRIKEPYQLVENKLSVEFKLIEYFFMKYVAPLITGSAPATVASFRDALRNTNLRNIPEARSLIEKAMQKCIDEARCVVESETLFPTLQDVKAQVMKELMCATSEEGRTSIELLVEQLVSGKGDALDKFKRNLESIWDLITSQSCTAGHVAADTWWKAVFQLSQQFSCLFAHSGIIFGKGGAQQAAAHNTLLMGFSGLERPVLAEQISSFDGSVPLGVDHVIGPTCVAVSKSKAIGSPGGELLKVWAGLVVYHTLFAGERSLLFCADSVVGGISLFSNVYVCISSSEANKIVTPGKILQLLLYFSRDGSGKMPTISFVVDRRSSVALKESIVMTYYPAQHQLRLCEGFDHSRLEEYIRKIDLANPEKSLTILFRGGVYSVEQFFAPRLLPPRLGYNREQLRMKGPSLLPNSSTDEQRAQAAYALLSAGMRDGVYNQKEVSGALSRHPCLNEFHVAAKAVFLGRVGSVAVLKQQAFCASGALSELMDLMLPPSPSRFESDKRNAVLVFVRLDRSGSGCLGDLELCLPGGTTGKLVSDVLPGRQDGVAYNLKRICHQVVTSSLEVACNTMGVELPGPKNYNWSSADPIMAGIISDVAGPFYPSDKLVGEWIEVIRKVATKSGRHDILGKLDEMRKQWSGHANVTPKDRPICYSNYGYLFFDLFGVFPGILGTITDPKAQENLLGNLEKVLDHCSDQKASAAPPHDPCVFEDKVLIPVILPLQKVLMSGFLFGDSADFLVILASVFQELTFSEVPLLLDYIANNILMFVDSLMNGSMPNCLDYLIRIARKKLDVAEDEAAESLAERIALKLITILGINSQCRGDNNVVGGIPEILENCNVAFLGGFVDWCVRLSNGIHEKISHEKKNFVALISARLNAVRVDEHLPKTPQQVIDGMREGLRNVPGQQIIKQKRRERQQQVSDEENKNLAGQYHVGNHRCHNNLCNAIIEFSEEFGNPRGSEARQRERGEVKAKGFVESLPRFMFTPKPKPKPEGKRPAATSSPPKFFPRT